MRHSIILTIIVASLLGCATNQISKVTSKAYIGMPLNEFLTIAGKGAILDSKNALSTVYRVYDYDMNGYKTDVRFFYFEFDKLTRIDGGVRVK